jgi:hypothetical protein
MQDIKPRRKVVAGSTIKRGKTKTPFFVKVVFIAILLLSFIAGVKHYINYDNGLLWLYNKPSVAFKMPPQSVLNNEEVLALMSPKKEVKKPVYRQTVKTGNVWTEREKKYKPLIYQYFPEEPEIMLAIAKAESGLNSSAIAYNCFYDKNGNVHTKRPKGGYSTFCKKGHEKYAWSKDGCAMQVNSSHGYDISTVEGCFKAARSVYERQGKLAWVAYKTGAYKKYLTKN